MARYLYFNNRDEFYRIKIDDIVYFEADKNYSVLHMITGQRIAFNISMQKMQEHMAKTLGDQARAFVRVGKSYIINSVYVFNIDLAKRLLKLLVPGAQGSFQLRVSYEALRKLRTLYVPE